MKLFLLMLYDSVYQLFDRFKVEICVTLLLLLMIVFASSCKITRQIDKQKTETTTELNASSDTRITTDDQTKTTITEKVDTSVVIPGTKISGESIGNKVTTIIDGDTLTASYDKVTNTIKAHFSSGPKLQSIHKDKVTEIQSNVKKDEVVNTDTSLITETKTEVKKKESKTNYVWFGLGSLVILILVGYFIYRYLKGKMIPFKL